MTMRIRLALFILAVAAPAQAPNPKPPETVIYLDNATVELTGVSLSMSQLPDGKWRIVVTAK